MSRPKLPSDLKQSFRESLRNRSDVPLPYKVNTEKSTRRRDELVSDWPEFDRVRDRVTTRRREALENLDALHTQLKANWEKNGVQLHEAKDAEAACEIILSILQKENADRLLKSKTMVSEEIGLNEYLENHGIQPIETDLGEYIVQLRKEAPSHITMPAMHLTRDDVGHLFEEKLGIPFTNDPPELTKVARKTLRKEFLAAKVGLCGVNFAVAETGHIVTVTNEGNGRMVTTMPRVVIALMGMERVTQSLEDVAQLWQLLALSATGQKATVYLNLQHSPSTGPAGPEEIHVVLLDNGRSRIYADPELNEVLRCIRCGACLNVCPVYRQVGGHPYGGTYPGPIGEVFTPALLGIEQAPDHPFASSLCGACEQICPVSIPIPELLLRLRDRKVQSGKTGKGEDLLWKQFETVMMKETRYRKASNLARGVQRILPASMLPVPGWTNHRDTPRFAGKSFRTLWEQKKRETDDE